MKSRRFAEGLSRIPSAVGFAAAICLATFIVVWPLWFFATRYKSAFTATALSAAACGIAAVSIKRIRDRAARSSRAKGGERAP